MTADRPPRPLVAKGGGAGGAEIVRSPKWIPDIVPGRVQLAEATLLAELDLAGSIFLRPAQIGGSPVTSCLCDIQINVEVQRPKVETSVGNTGPRSAPVVQPSVRNSSASST